MSDPYRSNVTPAEAVERLLAPGPAVVLTHGKPDGDALGASLAVARVRADRSLETHIHLASPIEAGLRSLFGDADVRIDEDPAPLDGTGVVIVVDTGSRGQLQPYADYVVDHRDRAITVDHHSRGEDLTAARLVDPDAPSTTAMLTEVFEGAGIEFAGGRDSVAEALFLGLATDTGWFRHANADAVAFALAARLLALGIEKDRLYQTIDQSYPPSRLALEARALASVVHARAGEAVVMGLSMDDFAATGAGLELTTGIVNMPLVVGPIRVAALLTQVEPALTKVSFRSKPPAPDDELGRFLDVNEMAGELGGGGHVHAAGARVAASLDDTRTRVLEVLEAASVRRREGAHA